MKPSSSVIHVLTKARRIRTANHDWSSRSDAPFRMLAQLWRQAIELPAAWVAVSDLGPVLGTSTHPRQMQRIVDFLEPTGLLEFETRTRGRYRLAVLPDAVVFDLDDETLRSYAGRQELVAAPRQTTALHCDVLQEVLGGILHMDSSLFDGSLDTGDQSHICDSTVADMDWQSVLSLRGARMALGKGAWTDLNSHLRDIRELARLGALSQPLVEVRANLLAAKSCYDRGRYGEAERLLNESGGASCSDFSTQGSYHNIAGLCAYRRWRGELERHKASGHATPAPDRCGFQKAEEHYRHALLCQTLVSDYQGLQATTFNLGNACLTPAYLGLTYDETDLEQGLRWLGLCRYIYSHFFVGMDSVWGHILVLRTVLETEREFTEINRLAGHILGSLDNVLDAAKHTLEMAERIGNPTEVQAAHGLLRQARLASR